MNNYTQIIHPQIYFQKDDQNAHYPTRTHSTDAGFDLYLNSYLTNQDKWVTISPGTHILCKTGISCAIPRGYVGLISPRSGLALKYGLTVLNSPGIIDSGYRGDLGVIIFNASPQEQKLKHQDRIAQLVVLPCNTFSSNGKLPNHYPTDRGSNGFGSSGY